jgi:hypothetical protein
MILVAGKWKYFGWFSIEFWLKTIEFGDITIKSVGDFLIKFGYG